MSSSPSPVSVLNPLCIILVKNGSKGDRLLFRYPYKTYSRHSSEEVEDFRGNKTNNNNNNLHGAALGRSARSGSISLSSTGNMSQLGNNNSSVFLGTSISECHDSSSGSIASNSNNHNRSRKVSRNSPPPLSRRSNPYAVIKSSMCDDIFSNCRTNERVSARDAVLGDLSDKDLANLLAVNSDLSEKKFELKINEVRFVGHPTLMNSPRDRRPLNPAYQTSVKLFNVVFCLHAKASHSIVKCFHDLSKRLGIGLRHEEYRVGYLGREMKEIIRKLDEACVDHMDEDPRTSKEMLFNDILLLSNLAKLLKKVYDDVCGSGFVRLKINNWVQVSFCLPQKIHTLPFRKKAPLVEPENIHKCLEAIRPFHAILLLVDRDELVKSFWLDASSTILRLLEVYSPLKSLQTMAADADLTLSQVVEIASHLVYWAAAIVIYPMCESNVYVIAPDAPISSPDLASAFSESFQGISLYQTLGDFSLPMPLGERINPLLGVTASQVQLVQLVCWLLKHRLLYQLHTYIYLTTTYLDCSYSSLASGIANPRLSETEDEDGSLKFSSLRYDEHEDEDEGAVSDSSETTNEDIRHVIGRSSPVPVPTATVTTFPEQEVINRGNRVSVPLGYNLSSAEYDHHNNNRAKREREEGGDTDRDIICENEDESHLLDPIEKLKGSLWCGMQDTVRRAVSHIRGPLSSQDIKMFSRLSKYFTGEFHLEEIMYRENVRRSQLMLLLDKFRDVLITVERDDSDINFFRLEEVIP